MFKRKKIKSTALNKVEELKYIEIAHKYALENQIDWEEDISVLDKGNNIIEVCTASQWLGGNALFFICKKTLEVSNFKYYDA